MKLLIITQKVSKADSNLGFLHNWIIEFSRNCESVIVICLEKGGYDFPSNVRVLSLGKEHTKSRISYLYNFFTYIISERKNYDAVFVHMNQLYVLLGAIFWKLWSKKIALWYTHKSVTVSLRLAEKMTDIIFTASKESFRIRSKKVFVMGHGIETSLFEKSKTRESKDVLSIVTVGRISRSKHILDIIKCSSYLVRFQDYLYMDIKILFIPFLFF